MEGNYPSRNLGSSRVAAEFTFTAPGSGTSVAVSGVDGADVVASIAHTAGTNIITVTLNKKYKKIIAADAQLVSTTGNWSNVGSISNEGSATTAPSFTIYTWVAAGTVSNDNADRVMVRLSLKYGYQGVK